MNQSFQNNLNKIYKEIRFKPENFFALDEENQSCIVSGKVGDQSVLLKVLSVKDERLIRFQKEVEVDKFLQSFNDNSDRKISKVSVLGSGLIKGYFWLTREYVAGKTLSSYSNKDKPLFGYDVLDSGLADKRESILNQILENVGLVQKITDKKSYHVMYDNELDNDLFSDLSLSLSINLKKQQEFWNLKKILYQDGPNIKASFADIVPSNIIISNDGKVVMSDFEWFCFDNYTMDYACLWLFLWRHPDWQRIITDFCVKSEEDKDFFVASLIRIIFGWYKVPFLKKDPIHSTQERKNYFKNHIWTKYLIAAGESFDAIMKVKE